MYYNKDKLVLSGQNGKRLLQSVDQSVPSQMQVPGTRHLHHIKATTSQRCDKYTVWQEKP